MRRIAALAFVVAGLLGAAACTEANLTAEDAYKVGCPAVDAAVAGGSVVGKATVAGLRKLSESGSLDPEPQRWVDATISLLDSSNPGGTSDEAKRLIIKGCADNGYPLRNLK